MTKFKLNKFGSFALLVIIWSTYDQAFRSRAFDSVPSSNMIFVVFISVACFILFLGICFLTSLIWLPKADVISICYCVPAKSPALGVPLVNVMFAGISTQLKSKLSMPMVIYQGLQIVFGSLLTLAFRNWIKRDEEARKQQAELENEEGVIPTQIS